MLNLDDLRAINEVVAYARKKHEEEVLKAKDGNVDASRFAELEITRENIAITTAIIRRELIEYDERMLYKK